MGSRNDVGCRPAVRGAPLPCLAAGIVPPPRGRLGWRAALVLLLAAFAIRAIWFGCRSSLDMMMGSINGVGRPSGRGWRLGENRRRASGSHQL